MLLPHPEGGYEPKERDSRIIQEFKRRNTRQRFFLLSLLIIGIFMIWMEDHPIKLISGVPNLLLTLLLWSLLISLLVFSFTNWRCPGCHRYLLRWLFPDFCERCGIQLVGTGMLPCPSCLGYRSLFYSPRFCPRCGVSLSSR